MSTVFYVEIYGTREIGMVSLNRDFEVYFPHRKSHKKARFRRLAWRAACRLMHDVPEKGEYQLYIRR